MTEMPSGDSWTTKQKLQWDAWNRLMRVSEGSTTICKFEYDALTRQIILNNTSVTQDSYYDQQWRRIEDWVAGSIRAHHLWSPLDRWTLIRRKRSNGGTLNDVLWCLKDYLDPVAVITPGAVVQERFRYDAFGNMAFMTAAFGSRSTSSYSWNYLFHGEFLNGDLGLYNYGYRFYHPNLGRWISRDPIEEKGGLNLFGFVGNNGVNKLDYLGQYGDWSGFAYWLSGLGAAGGRMSGNVRIPWSDFDPSGSQRDSLELAWKRKNRSYIRSKCELLSVGGDDKFKVLGRIDMPGFTSEMPWISNYQSYALGSTQFGDNVEIEKYIDAKGHCICEIYAYIDLIAEDDLDFNPGDSFGPGGFFQDNWFIWLRDNTPIGYDYKINAFENKQISWKEKF